VSEVNRSASSSTDIQILILRALQSLTDSISPTVADRMDQIAQADGAIDWVSYCHDNLPEFRNSPRTYSASDPYFLLHVVRRWWYSIRSDQIEGVRPDFEFLMTCRNEFAHFVRLDATTFHKLARECLAMETQLGCTPVEIKRPQFEDSAAETATRIQATPLEEVLIGEDARVSSRPSTGRTEPHLVAFGPVGFPVYETIWALVQASLGEAGDKSRTVVRETLKQLPEGLLEGLGISITEESARWMTLGDLGVASVDRSAFLQWIDDRVNEDCLDDVHTESVPQDFVYRGYPFKDLLEEANRDFWERDDRDVWSGDDTARPPTADELVLPSEGRRTYVAGLEPPVGQLWYLTQEDCSVLEQAYCHCALIFSDSHPVGSLAAAFGVWARENLDAVVQALDKDEQRAHVEARLPSAAWDGFAEPGDISYSAADIWSRLPVGVESGVSGSPGVVLLATSWEGARIWNHSRSPTIVSTAEFDDSSL